MFKKIHIYPCVLVSHFPCSGTRISGLCEALLQFCHLSAEFFWNYPICLCSTYSQVLKHQIPRATSLGPSYTEGAIVVVIHRHKQLLSGRNRPVWVLFQNDDRFLREGRAYNDDQWWDIPNLTWLVVSNPLKDMKVNWDDYSQCMEKYEIFQTTNQYPIYQIYQIKSAGPS